MITLPRTVRAAVATGFGASLVSGAALVPASADTTSTTLHVNFQSASSSAPSGYVADFGQAYDATRGFGWTTNSGTPLDLTANGRRRNINTNPLLDTLVQMQASPNSGNTTPGSWRAAVADGTYTVTVGVGDPAYVDSHDVINVEGQKVVDFTPTAANRQLVSTATVAVSGGFLTIDAMGGTNTKIDYLDVTAGTGGGQPPSMRVSSPEDDLALGSRMVFSTVLNERRAGHSITLTNSGGSALHVSGLTFGGPNAGDFQLCTGQATSLVVPAGSSAPVCVRYTPLVDAVANGTQTSKGTLTVSSDDSSAPNVVVTLGGLNAKNYGSFHEPSLQQILDALGYKDNVLVSNKPQGNSISPLSTAVGDEVLSPYFTRLNASSPVQLVPLAHYSGKSSTTSASFGWYSKGTSTNNYLYAFPGGADGSNDGYGQNQLLLPTTTTGSSGINSLGFVPPGPFGLVDNYPGYSSHSDDAKNSYGWHNLRVYPAKDANGSVINGTYIVGNDIGGPADNSAKNWDYQDFAFLLVNATPDTSAKQPTPGEYSKALSSFPGTAGGIAGTGFTTAQSVVTPSAISFVGGRLQITTANDSNTSHTNALQLGVNAGTRFRVQCRLSGPFDAINAGAEQQGIYFGPNGSNYIKGEVEWNAADGARHLTIWKEVNGAGAIVNSVVLPGGNANTIDLRIDVDPSPQDGAHYNKDPLVTISYALNGAATFAKLNTADLYIPPSWISANAPAGIVTSHQQGGSAFAATYANFVVSHP